VEVTRGATAHISSGVGVASSAASDDQRYTDVIAELGVVVALLHTHASVLCDAVADGTACFDQVIGCYEKHIQMESVLLEQLQACCSEPVCRRGVNRSRSR
jgi:hypothetical protein